MGDSVQGSPARSVQSEGLSSGLESESESECGGQGVESEAEEDDSLPQTIVEGWLKHRGLKKVSHIRRIKVDRTSLTLPVQVLKACKSLNC